MLFILLFLFTANRENGQKRQGRYETKPHDLLNSSPLIFGPNCHEYGH